MMTPDQYRLRALDALEVAKRATDPQIQSAWEATALEWEALADLADRQESFQQSHTDSGPE